MCNAWNHPPDCSCGWGGSFYGSAGAYSRQTNFVTPASYVNPNATCPVCGAQVFYYQSPCGGRVFFDELGPPWPKHPCTDNCRPITRSEGALSRSYSWQSEGWEPLIITSSQPFNAQVAVLTCTFGDSELKLYILRGRDSSVSEFSSASIVQAKKLNAFRYLLSTIDSHAQEIRLFAHMRSFDAQHGEQIALIGGKRVIKAK